MTTKKVTIHKGNIGNKKGWAFSVHFDNREYPNIISALYKTKRETIIKADEYLEDDKLEMYGSAE